MDSDVGFCTLESLLDEIDRPGDYYVSGKFEVPMPKIEIGEDIGMLSFPIPEYQIKQLIQQATRGPFGRGTETILDTSVRKVWQLTPDQLKISGSTWPNNFKKLVSKIEVGLGCPVGSVTAELYKMLIYEEGGFFLPHRDSQKSHGMFGTLVVCLPCLHEGGELFIRHAGKEVSLDLSSAEVSELNYAAFYADCEHELKPVRKGNRVCLVYNLVQDLEDDEDILQAPCCDEQIKQAAKMIPLVMKTEGVHKFAYLLEHQYAPATLSFHRLKNADQAKGQFLKKAAALAKCEIYLGIVHIERTGAAEYSGYGYGYRRTSYSRSKKYRQIKAEEGEDDDEDYDEEEDEDEDDGIIMGEEIESHRYVDTWKDVDGHLQKLGKIDFRSNEIIPEDALEGEDPDEKRYMEATGNEGATVEYFYHRAVVVLWKQSQFVQVLLDGGLTGPVHYLSKSIQEKKKTPEELNRIALTIIKRWEGASSKEIHFSGEYDRGQKEVKKNRQIMLQNLVELQDQNLLVQFISNVISKNYDKSEELPLAAALKLLDDATLEMTLTTLLNDNDFMNRLNLLLHLHERKQVLDKLEDFLIEKFNTTDKYITSGFVTSIWLIVKGEDKLIKIIQKMNSSPSVYDPITTLAPALIEISKKRVDILSLFPSVFDRVSTSLLSRSEFLNEKSDWVFKTRLNCNCSDCVKLQAFIFADQQVCTFAVGKDRRQHLHQMIDRHRLDISHETDRHGIQTLVCTKRNQIGALIAKRRVKDVEIMQKMITIPIGSDSLRKRLTEAIQRKPGSYEVIVLDDD